MTDLDVAPRARIPADVDTPDRIVWGLTARQLAILAVAAMVGYSLLRALGPLVAPPVLAAVLTPLAGAAIVLAIGRRDGLSMDAWLLAALRHIGAPKRLAPAPSGGRAPVPGWAPQVADRRGRPARGTRAVPAVPVLRLPAEAISEQGVIDTGAQAVALVACTTVNIGLRTGEEQAALLGAYGQWLNSLTSPTQIVVSTQRVDLSSHAQRIADTAETIANPALAETAYDYAGFLAQLADRCDPLCRTVTIALTAPAGRDTDVLRRAEHTAATLTSLGTQTAVLDGDRVTAVLTCATDPYTPTDLSWPRARPDAVLSTYGDHP